MINVLILKEETSLGIGLLTSYDLLLKIMQIILLKVMQYIHI